MLTRILSFLIALIFGNFIVSAQPLQFENRGIGGGGALFSPAISPHDADNLYMSCDMTELFVSNNGGQSWGFFASADLTAFQNSEVQFTSDPDRLYVLALQFREEFTFPVRSNDGGQSWSPVVDPTGGEALYLYANPNETDQLFVSTWGQLWFSDDGGTSWTLSYTDPEDNLHIAGVFWNGTTVYIGTNSGMLISVNGGQTAMLDSNPGLPANTGFATFTGAKTGNTLTLYGIGLHQADLYPTVQAWEYSGYQNIFRRQMGTNPTNWEPVGTGIPGSVGLFQVASAGNNPEIVYVAGTNDSNSYPVVYKSTNSGDDWEAVFQTQNNQNITTGWSGYQGDEDWYYGEYALGLAVSFSDPDQVLLTDLGFAHRSTDGGQSWKQAYVNQGDENSAGAATPKKQLYQGNGLENTSAWWMHWTSPDQVFSAFTDIGGMASPDAGLNWTFDKVDRNLNSTYQFVESAGGTLYAATSSVHDLYQSTYLTDASINGGSGKILFSENQGTSWQTLKDFGYPVVSVAMDPNDADIMYAAVVHSSQGGIYKTENLLAGAASNWIKLPNPPRTEGHPLSLWVLNDSSISCSFAGRRTSNFTASSGVFYSSDGGQTWEDRSHPDMFYWTKDLVIDPNDPSQNIWYAAVFSGWGGAANNKGGLFRSGDRGQNWEKILNSFRVESIGIQPGQPNIAYVSTEDEGLLFTNNLNTNQPDFTQFSAYRFLHPLRIFFNPFNSDEIWVTSFGNGMSIGVNTVATKLFTNTAQIRISPNPGNGEIQILTENIKSGTGQIEILGSDGKLIQRAPCIISSEAIQLDLSHLSAGIYFLKLFVEDDIYLEKIIRL